MRKSKKVLKLRTNAGVALIDPVGFSLDMEKCCAIQQVQQASRHSMVHLSDKEGCDIKCKSSAEDAFKATNPEGTIWKLV